MIFPLFKEAVLSGLLTDENTIKENIISIIDNPGGFININYAFEIAKHAIEQGYITSDSSRQELGNALSKKLEDPKLQNTNYYNLTELQNIVDLVYDKGVDQKLDDAMSQWDTLTSEP